jgi:ParB-like chromosome segregation protein Spo0J
MLQKKQKNTKAKREKPKMTRRGLTRISTDETVEGLKRRHTAAKRSQKSPQAVRLDELRIADQVFQWRRTGYDIEASTDHVLSLARALANNGKPLEPILVLPIGEHYYVIDGHHRVHAYHSVKWSRPLPVEIFDGTVDEARIEALVRNSKDKLRMTKEDKTEGAWKLVKEGSDLTVERVAEITQKSERQVYYMRSAWKQLHALPPERVPKDKSLSALTWRQARQVLDEKAVDFDADDWREQQAEKLVDELLKAKIVLSKHPDITALAIERIDPDLPRALVLEWFNFKELQEMIDEEGVEEYAF